MDPEALKRQAAARALEFVTPGMALGLGTGSTARHLVDLLGAKVRAGLRVICVPTSEATRAQAEGLGIPLTTLDERGELDLAIDGADEFDPALNLIKGGGGALLREKIVAAAAKRMVVIADASKRVETLGAFPLPIEIVPFGVEATLVHVRAAFARLGLSGEIKLRRRDGRNFVTDGGHWIVDCALRKIVDPPRLAELLSTIPGVVEHGLFIGLAEVAVVATAAGVDLVRAARQPVAGAGHADP